MTTIVFGSSKGGVGKTTTALCMAMAFANAGAKVTIVDADPNSPISSWERITTKPIKNLTLRTDVSEQTILDVIEEASQSSDFVLVDLEGSANMTVSYAIGRADLVIIPMQGSQLDANEAAKVIRLIRQNSKAFRREIPYAAVFTRTSYITPRTAKHIKHEIASNHVPVLPVEMTERDAFKAIFTYGGSIYDLTSDEVSSPEKAINNIEALTQSVVDYVREVS